MKKYTFKNLYFESTRVCNLKCAMCMTGSNEPGVVKKSVKEQLNKNEIERYVFAPAREIGIETITWSGGEFSLRPDAVELIALAKEYGYTSIIATNGLTMTPERLRELNDAGGGTVVIAVGINSLDRDNVATRDASHDLSIEVLERCKELGIRRNVVVTIGKHNRDTIGQTLQWLADGRIPYNRSPFTARGSAAGHWRENRLTSEDMEHCFHPELRKHPLGYISFTPFFLSPEVHEKYSRGNRNVTVPQNPSIGCWCGTWLALNAEGDVSPCAILLDKVRCGNVREKSFSQIIDESPAFQQVLDRSLLKGKCGRCRYKYTCGGCRALAYFEHGDIMAEDPTCFFEPKDETSVSPHEAEINSNFKKYVTMDRYVNSITKSNLKKR
ncbi:MAG: radical SAM protein [bacterium]|nr:radical SAM protein [bacterium]